MFFWGMVLCNVLLRKVTGIVVSIGGHNKVQGITSQMTSEYFLFVLCSYVVAVMIKLSRSYDLEMIINVSEQYNLLLCMCYVEEWF
jgi:hypothetical protein